MVGVGHVMAQMQSGRSVAYRRIAACVELGLLERIRLLRDEPTILRATRDGLDDAGLDLPVATVKPDMVRHHLRCADVAIRAARHYGADRVLPEREFAWRERAEAPGKDHHRLADGDARRSPRRVHHLCEPDQTRRAVERAVPKAHAEKSIVVSEVER